MCFCNPEMEQRFFKNADLQHCGILVIPTDQLSPRPMYVASNGANGFAGSYGGGKLGGGQPSSRGPLPHISDLTSVSAGVDPNLPIRKLLEAGDGCMRQADTWVTFNRPDLALQEYIRGYIIAIQIIPHHKETADAKFEKIKEDIKADNERTGVQPVQKGATRPESPRSPPPPPPPPNHPPPPSPPRQKPAVQPKPQALHGNSIQSNSLHRRADSADLNARFANLRAPSTQPQPPQQDPRIKTLPKVPDAIYSPARGTVTSEDAQLPSSTPRGLFSRTGSSTSITGPRNGSVTSLAQQSTTNGIRSARGSVESKPPMLIPETPAITPEQLYDLMRSRSGDILLIDVRSREDFESGHILSQHTICIEPSVLLRENISAGDIGESNVLAPLEEQRTFERRDKFELVVLYDEDSKMIPYLRNAPKLLEGGLDAWVDLMGPNSLRTLASGKTSAAALGVPSWSLGASGPKPKAFGARRLSTYKVKPLRPDEVKQWEETIRKEDMDVEQSPNFVRSTEDFLRRFPPVLLEQESMTSSSPSGPDGLPRVPSSINDQLAKYDELPVPQRVLPRPFLDLVTAA
ncbi:unnamed protein product [Parascedosporium putredinis]|uniref:Rhodanese domain-containing protein n=1 Tax=Parascedosporium putredinis TaxID=1442378 RepID=A0A9P1HE29_9PEZI|nr:unnamed protein product [Parascedosporium putredinis]CAI8004631.1 unnamed protein product [Parascedosporium putredinis]